MKLALAASVISLLIIISNVFLTVHGAKEEADDDPSNSPSISSSNSVYDPSFEEPGSLMGVSEDLSPMYAARLAAFYDHFSKRNNNNNFNPWGGKKRSSNGVPYPELDKKNTNNFNPWGGKKRSFDAALYPDLDKKNTNNFNPWGGKKKSLDGANYPELDKKNTNNFNPWGGKKKSLDGGQFPELDKKNTNNFNPWGGKRDLRNFILNRSIKNEMPDNRKVFNPWGG